MISKRSFSQTALKRFLKKPQFNVKSIVNDLPQYRESIAKRQLVAGAGLLEGLQNLPEAYETIRGLNHKIALVQGQRKSLEAEIKNDRSKIEVRASEIKSLKSQYQLISKELDLAELKVTDMCSSLPNLVSPNSPATEPQIVHWINPQDSYEPDAKRDHVNIMVEKGLVDFQTASNVSGTSWFYLLNEGAELEQALVSYALKQAKEAGFQVCIPPSIVRNEVIDSCGFRPRALEA